MYKPINDDTEKSIELSINSEIFRLEKEYNEKILMKTTELEKESAIKLEERQKVLENEFAIKLSERQNLLENEFAIKLEERQKVIENVFADKQEQFVNNDSINSLNNRKITAVIPVRSGSTRCKNKNIREFGDTNLLKRKIETLKKIQEIDEIIVSSNCDEMLNIAVECCVKIDKRDEYYAQTNTSGSDLFYYLSTICNNDIMMYVHAVCPFVSCENYQIMIDLYYDKCLLNQTHDCIVSSIKLNHFMWRDNKPNNYDPFNAVPSQYLPDTYSPTFSPIIINKNFVTKSRSIIGFRPFFYELSQIEGIDIDTQYDFTISELLYKNNFFDNDDIVNYLNRCDTIKTELLDCTIRDGGYINNWNFTDEEVLECYKAISQAGYDYCEIGFLGNDISKGKYFNLSQSIINNLYESFNGCKIVCMIDFSNINILLEQSKIQHLTLVRVLFNYFKNEKKISEYVENIYQLIYLGYEVCVNIAYADRLETNQIDEIISQISHLKLKSIYLADTCGYLNEETTRKQLYNFQKTLYKYNSIIPLGFHPHNNMNNAIGKSKIALDFKIKMLDSTIYGLGRGAGNLQTELIILELNRKFNYDKYNVLPILNYGDRYIRKFNDKYINSQYIYGNSVLYAITGHFNIHPDYVNHILKYHNEKPIETIYNFFKQLSESKLSYCFDSKLIIL